MVSWTRLLSREASKRSSLSKRSAMRLRGFESMEPRYVLAANPIDVGIVYVEQDSGSDLHGDSFELTFSGGAEGTQLQRVVIDGDHELNGFSVGDVFFDTTAGGLGADDAAPFVLRAHQGIDKITATVSDGTTRLVLDFEGFEAGQRLLFDIDVDEVEDYETTYTDLDFINEGFDPITSGVEFQNSHFTAEFTAPHYFEIDGAATFRNRYDVELAASDLDLPTDDAEGRRDRSAAAFILDLEQQPLPSSIRGRVQLSDEAGNCFGESTNHRPVAGATVYLLDAAGNIIGQTVTDANGEYEFTDLAPGTYGVMEVTPDQYLDGGAHAGQFEGETRGEVDGAGAVVGIDLNGGEDLVDVLFCEHVGATLSGHVFHDVDNDGLREPGEEGIGSVLVTLLDADGNSVEVQLTDNSGFYQFTQLTAGTYSIIESQPFGFIDGLDKAGQIDGTTRGAAVNPGDRIDGVQLNWGEDAIDYDFGEYRTASIGGRVQRSTRDGDCFGENVDHDPVVGAVVQLLDADGNVIEETVTDENGEYEFTNLVPGEYGIREITPTDLLDAGANVGGVEGDLRGVVDAEGTIRGVGLSSGEEGTGFDFCDHVPAMISGHVFHDQNQSGQRDSGEEPISGVEVQLLDEQSNVVATTFTDADGFYKFAGIEAGTYSLREIQPTGFLDGDDSPGLNNGMRSGVADKNGDTIRAIDIGFGDIGTDYDFGELRAASIAGRVHSDIVLDCELNPEDGEVALSDVTVQLVDASGNVVAETTTDAGGNYEFNDLVPGDYTIRQVQPEGYFDGQQVAGSQGGDDSVTNEIAVTVGSGESLTDYNFCETPPASLSGYVFQDGPTVELIEGEDLPERIRDVRDGVRSADDEYLAGVLVELRHGTTGEALLAEDIALPGFYSDGPLTTTTDANGFYEFAGIRPFTYAVYEQQPSGFVDGVDTPGTTSGIVFNPGEPQAANIMDALVLNPQNDAIVRVTVSPGSQSLENNFSEVAVNFTAPPVDPPPRFPPPNFPNTPVPPPRTIPLAPGEGFNPTAPSPGGYQVQSVGAIAVVASPRTWHLSIINGGQPRGDGVIVENVTSTWFTAGPGAARVQTVDAGQWQFPTAYGQRGSDTSISFGLVGAHPIAGDFDGDGRDEIGVYAAGEWFIDLNANGRWDEGDLWAKLGRRKDLPVTGDWDGDGKCDIGIFGREWDGDADAIAAEPGLPDSENDTHDELKNVPPEEEDATSRNRLLQHRAHGRIRADVIDHVFRYGKKDDYPVAGDWNGDGIATLGVFREGTWLLDVDGNGYQSSPDKEIEFGHKGDIPLVGDFDGNGVDDVAIYRDGVLIIDSNGNGKVDSSDRRIAVGQVVGTPVVGDFDGDGVDEVAVYRASGESRVIYEARRAG